MTLPLAIAAVALWELKRFSTFDIAQILNIQECDVDRVVHIKREANRGVMV